MPRYNPAKQGSRRLAAPDKPVKEALRIGIMVKTIGADHRIKGRRPKGQVLTVPDDELCIGQRLFLRDGNHPLLLTRLLRGVTATNSSILTICLLYIVLLFFVTSIYNR